MGMVKSYNGHTLGACGRLWERPGPRGCPWEDFVYCLRQFSGHVKPQASLGACSLGGDCVSPDSCLCHPRVGTAQRSPDLCLPVPACPLPSGSGGQLLLGSAPDVSPQIPSRQPLTWDSRPRTSWSPPAADAMGVVAACRAAPGQRPAPQCFPRSFLWPVWPLHRPAALLTLLSCGRGNAMGLPGRRGPIQTAGLAPLPTGSL